MSLRPSIPSAPTPSLLRRTFHTTPSLPARPAKSQLAHQHAKIPVYPYGPSLWYSQSNFGLYGGSRPQSGNTVSERTEIKNRRKWHPNVHSHRIWSNALNRFVRVKVLARVMRTIDKVGGLDEYLLGEKAGRIRELGMGGWALRWRLMRTEVVKERFRAQRKQMGLPEDGGWEAMMKREAGVTGEAEAEAVERAIDMALKKDEREAANGLDTGIELGASQAGALTGATAEQPRPVV